MRSKNRRVAIALLILAADASLIVHYKRKMERQTHWSWNPHSRSFDWRSGSIRIPEGFHYERENGIDSFVGTFQSDADSSRIEHDIGELAGEHGNFGVNVVSFPDDGCANFRVEAASAERSAELVQAIRSSFKTNSSLPAWCRGLLPKLIRSDCRQHRWF